MDSNITIKNLNVSFSTDHARVSAVKDVNAVFEEGKITGLIGESGSGKSVLGMSILRLLPLTAEIQGECLYQGVDLAGCSEEYVRRIRGQEIALIPQNPAESLNPVIKIKRQLTEALTVHQRRQKTTALTRSRKLLERFGFDRPDEILNSYSFQLSGGMNQRVISALGLMCGPKWIIADEPTKGLDSILRRQVYHVLKEIVQTDTSSMILITHDITLAEKLCHNLMVLYAGQIMEQGNIDKLLDHPLHPYTRGLIASQPSRGMVPVEGVFPGREGKLQGCVFYPRCRLAKKRCGSECPGDYQVDSGTIVRCFAYA